MSKILEKLPDFKSEQEEAEWWSNNQDTMLAALNDAAESGTLTRGTLARRHGLTPTTTIRLDPSDIELAKVQAQERGLRYQTYLKMIIHQALTKEARESSGSGAL